MDTRKCPTGRPMENSKCSGLVVVFLIIAFVHSTHAFEKALERVKLEGHDNHDIDIYIERRITYLHSKIDLKPTHDGLLMLEKCALRFEQGSNTVLSRALASHVKLRLDKISNKLSRVTDHHPDKHKRSIEFIGDLWSDLFGNPGPSDWKQINSNIIALKSAIQKQDENANLDHTDIDVNRHAIEKHNKEISTLVSVLNKARAELTKVDDDISFLKTYVEILTLADAVETQVDYLIEVKVDSLKGFCNDRALSKEFLVDNLLSIEANKIGLGPVFGSWEWREFYKNKMCSVALNGKDLWITLRIPLVKKAEKMVRVIPSFEINKLLKKAADYGLVVMLFKECVNEKYHTMTLTSFDLCNVLGNTRTCGVRETKFAVGPITVMPIEFSLNRFITISMSPLSFKIMSKCPNGIMEHLVLTDSVLLVPNNCSYTSKYLTIDTRESDVAITKEIGIIHFDKFEVSKVESSHVNSTILVEEVLNSSRSVTFERNRNEIKEKLNNVKTSHESFLKAYAVEKWIIVSTLVSLAVLVFGFKIKSLFSKRRASKPVVEEIELGNMQLIHERPLQHDHDSTNDTLLQQQQQALNLQKQQQQQQPQLQQHQRMSDLGRDISTDDKRRSHVYSEIVGTGGVSFSSRPEHSQFLNK